MREPKKVRLGNQTVRFPKSRKQLQQEADRELWNKLNKIGRMGSGSVVSSGSEAVDERLKRTIGAPKGDPTVGLWHGEQTGPILYPGTVMTVTQYRRIVFKTTKWQDGRASETVEVCRIWVDDTVDGLEACNEIARQFGGDFLTEMPLGTPHKEYTRRYKRAPDDPNRANKE
jgi:hypothetical protein